MKYQVRLHNRPFIHPFIVHSCEPFMFIHGRPFMSIHVDPSISFIPIPSHSQQPYHLIRTYSIPFLSTLPSHSYLFHPIHVNHTVPFVPIPSHSYTFTNYYFYNLRMHSSTILLYYITEMFKNILQCNSIAIILLQ